MSTQTSRTTEEFHEVNESDYAVLYEEQKAENERLRDIIAASRINPVTPHPQRDAKPALTADALVSRVGRIAVNNMTRSDKLRSLGIPEEGVNDDLLRKCFAKSNSGAEARELYNSNPYRYRQLKEAAKILNIFGN